MLIAVDGTGPYLDKTYYEEMANSFVRRISNECPDPKNLKHYYRGPSMLGEECLPIAYVAATVIVRTYAALKALGKESSFKLFLTGYSRGGATVIFIAKLLQQSAPDIKVDCMALFDAVDRSSLTGVDVISGNVKICYHALRDPKAESRTWFGNCGLSIFPPGKMEMRKFFSTHAGLGGMPWTGDHPTKRVTNSNFDLAKFAKEHPYAFAKAGYPPEATIEVPIITKKQDEDGSEAVRSWMWANMKKHRMVSA